MWQPILGTLCVFVASPMLRSLNSSSGGGECWRNDVRWNPQGWALLWCARELDLGTRCISFPTSSHAGCVHLAELAGTKT